MILVDTNIIIDYWKNPSDSITEIFKKEDIAICGIIQAELLHGARSEKNIADILDAVSCFENLPYSDNWEKLGKMLYKLRTAGLTVPLADVIITQVAIENEISLFSKDKHFELIKQVFPELKLYN